MIFWKKETAFTEAVEVSMALCAQKHNSVTTIINNQLLAWIKSSLSDGEAWNKGCMWELEKEINPASV